MSSQQSVEHPEDLSVNIQSFQRHLKAENKSPATIRTYMEAVRLFERFLEENGHTRLRRAVGLSGVWISSGIAGMDQYVIRPVESIRASGGLAWISRLKRAHPCLPVDHGQHRARARKVPGLTPLRRTLQFGPIPRPCELFRPRVSGGLESRRAQQATRVGYRKLRYSRSLARCRAH